MTRRRDRFADEESPARRREERAKRTKGEIQETLRELSKEEYKRAKERDWEEVKRVLEGREHPNDYRRLLAGSKVAPDERLGVNRKKTPGIGRPPWAYQINASSRTRVS